MWMGDMFTWIGHLQTHNMKTIQCTIPGTLQMTERSMPAAEPGTTILRIKRIGVCGTDLHAFEGTQPYFNYPRVLGHELAAEVVETDAIGFRAGDAVTIMPYFSCGVCVACRQGKTNCCVQLRVAGVHVDGGMKEYMAVPSSSLVRSEGLNLDELAIVEPLAIGAHGVRRAGIKDGEFVLVIGAGPIGLGLMEMSRIAGARVIAMEANQHRRDFCKTIPGIEAVIHAGDTDVKDQLMQLTGQDMPAVVMDATGSLNAINKGFEYLAHGGRYVLVGLQKGMIQVNHPEFHKREATLMSSRNATREDFEHVIHTIKENKIRPQAYITHRLDFDAVPARFPELLDPAGNVIKAVINL
jgi:2-desacetyl-2-hydroxyethyl bacteriochlorophyllide A dehydrogenase